MIAMKAFIISCTLCHREEMVLVLVHISLCLLIKTTIQGYTCSVVRRTKQPLKLFGYHWRNGPPKSPETSVTQQPRIYTNHLVN